jgi:large subunit ribosomal protein L23
VNDIYKIIKKPIITEKSTILRAENNKVAFWVDIKANKNEVKKAVERAFNVKIVDVNSIRVPGKRKRVGKSEGMTPTRKKVYVTLKEGEKIDIFEGV